MCLPSVCTGRKPCTWILLKIHLQDIMFGVNNSRNVMFESNNSRIPPVVPTLVCLRSPLRSSPFTSGSVLTIYSIIKLSPMQLFKFPLFLPFCSLLLPLLPHPAHLSSPCPLHSTRDPAARCRTCPRPQHRVTYTKQSSGCLGFNE